MIVAEHNAKHILFRDECFLILQLLAEEAPGGVEDSYLLQAVRHHRDGCPKCCENHLQRLKVLKARYHSIEKLTTRMEW